MNPEIMVIEVTGHLKWKCGGSWQTASYIFLHWCLMNLLEINIPKTRPGHWPDGWCRKERTSLWCHFLGRTSIHSDSEVTKSLGYKMALLHHSIIILWYRWRPSEILSSEFDHLNYISFLQFCTLKSFLLILFSPFLPFLSPFSSIQPTKIKTKIKIQTTLALK